MKAKKKNNISKTITGRISTLYYSSASFSAGKIETQGGEATSFAGSLMVEEGDIVKLHGDWKEHPKYGRQFQAVSFEFDLPIDPDGLELYLANNPRIKGIGPVKSKLISEKFGHNFENALFEHSELISKHAKLKIDVILKLQAEWKHTRTLNRALIWLASFGLTFNQISTLVDKFGNSVVSILKDNPYVLISTIRAYGFRKVDSIALKMGITKDNSHRIEAGIQSCINEQLDSGNSWTDMEDLITQANRLLVMDSLNSRELIEQELDSIIEKKGLSCTSHGGRFLIARPDLHQMEHELHRKFCSVHKLRNKICSESKINSLIKKHAPTLNDDQRIAVRSALTSGITVITGGAGSGKTYSTKAITDIYHSLDKTVILSAPTGKAAMRMQETVGIPAFTIHRLLKYNGVTYKIENPIDADLIIIDEFSMVNIPIASKLFEYIDLEKTTVIIVGDHNQLPPIGPGNILQDLIETKLVPCVRLNKVVRQAGVLKSNCTAILEGEVKKTDPESIDGRRAWYLIDQFKNAQDIQRFIIDLYETVIEERMGFDLQNDVQLLSPTKKGPLGVWELNIILQRVIQKKLYDVNVPPPKPGFRPKFYPHDRVIQTRNNYEIGVFNGTLGRVLEVRSDGSLSVEFETNIVEIELGSQEMRDISLAYSLTIHKVQGSEFPCVISIIHKSHSFMHNRNLFYTAVTRSQKSAVIIGDKWGLRNCAQKKMIDRRRTFLSILGNGNVK